MSEHEFGVDIAERQQAEQAQRRMDELFRALIENALDVITIIDVEGVIRYQSPSVERVLGYKPAELIGVNIVELLHPDDVPKVNAAIKAVAPPNGTPGMAQVVEARLRHKDGSWRILESIGKELPGIPSVTGIVLNSRDITERVRAEEEIRQRNRELAALNAIAAVVSQSLNLDEILNAALDKVLELMHLDVGGIYLADPVRRKLGLVVHRGISKEFAHEIGSVSVDEKTVEAVMAEGKLRRFIFSVKAVTKDRVELKRIVSAMKREGLSLASAVPVLLQAKEEILGLMIVASRVPRQFSEQELHLLTFIGQHVAVAIHNVQLYEDAARRLARLRTLREIDRAISSSLELKDRLDALLDKLTDLPHIDGVSVIILEPGTKRLETVAVRGLSEEFVEMAEVRLRDGLPGLVAEQEEPLAITDIIEDEQVVYRNLIEREELASFLGIPLLAKGELIGVLGIYSRERHRWSQEQTDFLHTLAGQAAITLENGRLYEAVRQELAERKRAEEALWQSEERHRAISEVISDYAYTHCVTPEGELQCEWLTESFTRVFGYAFEELEAPIDWSRVVYPDDMSVFRRHIERVLSGQTDVSEFRFVARKGEPRWLRNYTKPIWDEAQGRVVRIYGAAQDITERKLAEEEMRASEQRYRLLFERNLAGVYRSTLDGRILDCNESYARIFGYDSREEALALRASELYFDAADREKFIARLREQGTLTNSEWCLRRKDGSPVWVLENASLIEGEEGAPTFIQGTLVDITKRKRMERLLQALNQAARAMEKALTPEEIFAAVAEELKKLSFLCAVLLTDESRKRLFPKYFSYEAKAIKAAEKLVGLKAEDLPIPVETVEVYRKVIREGKTVFVENAEEVVRQFLPGPAKRLARQIAKMLKLSKSIDAPLVAEGEVIGLLLVQSDDLTEDDIPAITAFAHQMAAAWRKAQLMQDLEKSLVEVKRSQEELQRTAENLRRTLGGTIRAMALTVETRDPYTAGHQRRVADLARAIATEMGLSKEQIDGIRMAGVIHDIGKMSVPAEILSKPGGLNDLQWGMIKAHPQIAYDLLKQIDFPWPVAQIVLQHHERMNGSGYPQGLSGEEIMLEARILAVADVVEAMASFRPYRPALGIDKALEEISQNKGILYDAGVVDVCLKLVTEKGFKFE